VAVLDTDLQGKGTHCSYCLRHIEGAPIRPASDRLNSVYCSSDCQTQHRAHSQTLLFTLESALPAAIAPEIPGKSRGDRDNAQVAFVEYLKESKKAASELVARFIARQVSAETAKMLPRGISLPGVASEPVLTDGGEYSLYDHLERLRYLEVQPAEHETRVLRDVLQTALPGLEQFITDERHATFVGKMSYNSYGVYFGEGREDKVRVLFCPSILMTSIYNVA
jgi:import receptor subunit TOM20